MKKSQICKIIIIVLAVIICAVFYFTFCINRNNNPSKQLGNFQDIEGATKTGVVTSASKGLISIQTATGENYIFEIGNNTTVNCPDENLGDMVSIEYEGEYSDFAIAKKISVIEEAADEDNTIVPENIPDAGMLFHVAGITTDVTKNYITIASGIESEDQYTIPTADNTVVDESIAIGDAVAIYCVNTSGVEPPAVFIKVVSPKPEKVDASTNIYHIVGTVASSDDATINILKDGYEYNIIKSSNIISDDIETGDTVRVYHTGSFTNGMNATYIEKIR